MTSPAGNDFAIIQLAYRHALSGKCEEIDRAGCGAGISPVHRIFSIEVLDGPGPGDPRSLALWWPAGRRRYGTTPNSSRNTRSHSSSVNTLSDRCPARVTISFLSAKVIRPSTVARVHTLFLVNGDSGEVWW
jgi:hypothetical protein